MICLSHRVTVHNPSEGILTACADGSLTLWNAINRNKYGTFEKGSLICAYFIL